MHPRPRRRTGTGPPVLRWRRVRPSASGVMSAVLITDLRTEECWPAFIREARNEKVLSIAAMPIKLQSETKAAVSFYSRRQHGFAIAPLRLSSMPPHRVYGSCFESPSWKKTNETSRPR